jgi:acetyl-CoA carboxylase biotin carboxyl carrier protein
MAEVKSPMAGTIFELIAAVGDEVEEGDELVILESMKMEIPVEAPIAGSVSDIHIAQGDQVQEGDTLVTIAD